MVLLGAALFVAGCFLSYYGFEHGQRTVSLYRQLVEPPSNDGVQFGGLLYMFAGVATVASIAILGVARG